MCVHTHTHIQIKQVKLENQDWGIETVSLFSLCICAGENVTTGGNHGEGTMDLSISFLTNAYEATIILIKIFS